MRLTAYADTLILDRQAAGTMLCAVRFGGYPEVTRAMADAIYGGAAVEATIGTETIRLQAMVKRYRRQFSHDGIYAVATLLANDEEPSCQGAGGSRRTDLHGTTAVLFILPCRRPGASL